MNSTALATSHPDPGDRLVLAGFLPFRLATAAQAVSRLIARACEERFALDVAASRAVCALADGTLPIAALPQITSLDRPAVESAVTHLEAHGLATRNGGEVALTSRGLEVHAELAALALAAEAALVSGLAPEDVRTMHRLLGRLEAAALKLSGRSD